MAILSWIEPTGFIAQLLQRDCIEPLAAKWVVGGRITVATVEQMHLQPEVSGIKTGNDGIADQALPRRADRGRIGEGVFA
ncbi:hypothetical protein [Synechococcus sp. EJ6-Ellesmere]|uniref:hypothetical protein n=1 Tax=Synechococcus sp. EJ6-Ellesmere TaxID=2823734 RepID=UPI0020CC6FEE|nr:hypothetical protein [Synechococcus sp. EJ6-Ellesmere]MCP9825823.1 hypothetical protein [Synechococcus sp. EJ6-Ellesmere]